MQQVLAIFDEDQSFIGIWSAEDKFSAHCLLGLEELWGPTLQAFSNPDILRFIPNESVDLGNKVRLDGGIFVMMPNDKAPNEELADPDSTVAYRLVRFDSVSCQVLMRARRTDPCITTPPRERLKQTRQAEVMAQHCVQTSVVPAKASGGRDRAQACGAPQQKETPLLIPGEGEGKLDQQTTNRGLELLALIFKTSMLALLLAALPIVGSYGVHWSRVDWRIVMYTACGYLVFFNFLIIIAWVCGSKDLWSGFGKDWTLRCISGNDNDDRRAAVLSAEAEIRNGLAASFPESEGYRVVEAAGAGLNNTCFRVTKGWTWRLAINLQPTSQEMYGLKIEMRMKSPVTEVLVMAGFLGGIALAVSYSVAQVPPWSIWATLILTLSSGIGFGAALWALFWPMLRPLKPTQAKILMGRLEKWATHGIENRATCLENIRNFGRAVWPD